MKKTTRLYRELIFASAMVVAIVFFAEAAVRPNASIQSELKAIFEHPPAVSGFPFQELVEQASDQYGLPVAYVLAVARGESFFDPQARSHKGALGIIQVMPSTAVEYGVGENDLLDPSQNIDVGVHYLADLYGMLQDPYLALAAYYCGPGRVDKVSFELRADCDEYVHYIHAHLKKVVGQIPSPYTAPSTAPFVLTRFDNYLDAQSFIDLLGSKVSRTEWDVLRKSRRMKDHHRYYYAVTVTLGTGQDKRTFCKEVLNTTGFRFCNQNSEL